MKRFVVAFLCMLPSILFANIRINEVMQSNVNGIMDDLNEFPDSWVEIYNEDTVAFDFTGYGIGLGADFAESYAITDSVVIPANGHLLIYCDKEDVGLHTNFRLDADGCTVVIFDTVGHVVDSLLVPAMLAPDIAYGRISDGNDTISYFKIATPGKTNAGFHTEKIMKKPSFSVKGGVYSSPVTLTLSLKGKCPADAVVRYTTNGSEPTEDSPIASDSILISETTVIRAKTFSDSALSRPSATHTYVILDREYSLPIVSIVTDSSNFYGDETGILVEGTYGLTHPDKQSEIPSLGNMNFLYSWKRPINFEYFDTRVGNTAAINQLCETEIGGNTSAIFRIKSLNVKANKRFGDNKFSYPFWSDKPDVTKSKTLYLRNSGQDFSCFHIRDAMNQMSFGHYVDVDWQACQPVVVLVNGNYYGMLNLREKVNEDYIWSNYNKLEDVDMIYENTYQVKAGDLDEFARYHILLNDTTTTLAQFDSMIDLNEFMNYFVLSVFYCNKDFPGNNQILWRERKPDAKWRFIIKDTDVTAGLMNDSRSDYPYFNYILRKEPYVKEGINSELGCLVFQRTMNFPEIANQVIDRTSVYMGTFISAERCVERLDSLSKILEPEIPFFYNEIERNTNDWYIWLGRHNDWVRERVPYLYSHISEFFSLGDTTSLIIKGEKKAPLYFNGVKVDKNYFNGKYYQERPLYLSRTDTTFSYQGDSVVIDKADSLSGTTCKWFVEYVQNGDTVRKSYNGNGLYLEIPKGVSNVLIVDEDTTGLFATDTLVVDTIPMDTLVIDPVGPDTLVVDTIPMDTLVIDPVGPDTLVVDTIPLDTLVIDPVGPDTLVIDTISMDTFVIDPKFPGSADVDPLNVMSLENLQIGVYPNPTHDYVTISGLKCGESVLLTDLVGRILKRCEAEKQSLIMDLSDLPNGCYIVRTERRFYKIQKQ